MATGNLREWLDGDRERLVWLEFDDYAHRVFANASPDWLSVANVFVSGVGQAFGVVPSEVLSIDILPPYRAASEELCGGAPEIIQAMLGSAVAQQFVGEVIDAFAHRFGDNVDLVLKIPSPGQLLRDVGLASSPSFDELDDIGIALSDVLRKFSEKPIAGVLIATTQPITEEEAEALESVVGAARHYGWQVSMSFDGLGTLPLGLADIRFDLLLLPEASSADITADSSPSIPLGGGLGNTYWQPGVPPEPAARRALLYGTIPADSEPEVIVERVRDLFA